MPLEVWTDGSSMSKLAVKRGGINYMPGSWAYIIKGETLIKGTGFEPELGGIGRMEVQAALNGVLYAYENLPGNQYILFSDSQYVVKGLTSWLPGWKKRGWLTSGQKPLANADLWQQFDILLTHLHLDAKWVPSHQNNGSLNDMADKMAKSLLLKSIENGISNAA